MKKRVSFHPLKIRRFLAGLLLPVFLLTSGCGNQPAAPETAPAPSGSAPSAAAAPAAKTDTSFTLLVYMIGSDLESVDGAASSDLSEIISAAPSGNLKVLIQTGGAERWYTEGISADSLQRHTVENGKLKTLAEVPKAQTSLPETLHDFLQWGLETAPADRYGVILWDHGGGAILGYGQDDFYPDITLSLADLHKAFEGLDAHFDFIGFDACLMGTMETALAFSPYADYLIASEEFEPATGWFYTDWVRALNADTSIPAKDLGVMIVDDFVSEKNAGPYDFCTLALIDLKKIPSLYDEVREWYHGYYNSFEDRFSALSKERMRVKSFGGGNYEQVDLMDLLKGSSGVPDSLLKNASETIVHAAHNKVVDVSSGLSLYYPYLHPEKYDPTAGSMTKTGFDTDYFAYYDSFITTIEYARLQRLAQEKKHDAFGIVEASGGMEKSAPSEGASGTAAASASTGSSGEESAEAPPLPDPEEMRFREYIKIHNLSAEEEELVSDVRLMQFNPVDNGYIYVGKETGGPVENGTGADLSGGHYLSIEDTLVSFELIYDSELALIEAPLAAPVEPAPGETPSGETAPGETAPGSPEEETSALAEEAPAEPETTSPEGEGQEASEPETTSSPQEGQEAPEPETASSSQEQESDPGLSASTFSAGDPTGKFDNFLGSREAVSISLHSFGVSNDLLESSEEEGAKAEDEEDGSKEEEHDDGWFRYGYVNAVLNGDDYVDLMVCWDKEHPQGIVAGYRPIPEEAVPLDSNHLYMPHRGLQELETGDELHFYFHHFDEEGNYDGIVFLDDPVTVGDGPLKTGECRKPFQHMEPGRLVMFYKDCVLLGDGDAIIAYKITDVYNNIYYVKAEDVWDPEDVIHVDPDKPEELYEELIRRFGAAPPDGNGPDDTPGGGQPQPAAANTAVPAAAAPAAPAANVPQAQPETQNTAPAQTDAAAQPEAAVSEGSYTVIGADTGEEITDARPVHNEYTDEEIDAFLNSEEEEETDPDDDDPEERTPAATQPAETKAQTEAAKPAETQAETETQAQTEAARPAETKAPEPAAGSSDTAASSEPAGNATEAAPAQTEAQTEAAAAAPETAAPATEAPVYDSDPMMDEPMNFDDFDFDGTADSP